MKCIDTYLYNYVILWLYSFISTKCSRIIFKKYVSVTVIGNGGSGGCIKSRMWWKGLEWGNNYDIKWEIGYEELGKIGISNFGERKEGTVM